LKDIVSHQRSTFWQRDHYALGQSDRSRCLFVVFALRGKLVRVISARDMTQNERTIYETYETEKGDSQL
jgi:uncharacterized DUF497 family protein